MHECWAFAAKTAWRNQPFQNERKNPVIRDQIAKRAMAAASSVSADSAATGRPDRRASRFCAKMRVRWPATSLTSPDRLNCASAPDSKNLTQTATCHADAAVDWTA